MGWFVAGVMLASFIVSLYLQQKAKTSAKPGSIETPTAEEGRPIPVLFGKKQINNGNIGYFGSTEIMRIENQFTYRGAILLALCHGKLDGICAVYANEKVAWEGWETTEDAQIYLNSWQGHPPVLVKPDGSGTAVLEEDGVLGRACLRMGGVNPNNGNETGDTGWMARTMGLAQVPKFYGVAAIWTPVAIDLGTSPYIRPWSVLCQRIHYMAGGTAQWYDAKAAISIGIARNDSWKYKMQAVGDATDYSGAAYDDSGWDVGTGSVSNAPAGKPVTLKDVPSYNMPIVGTCISGVDGLSGDDWVVPGTKIWLRQTVAAMPAEELGVRCWHDDTAQLWVNGTEVTLEPIIDIENFAGASIDYHRFNSRAKIPAALINTATPNVIAYCVRDTFNADGDRVGKPIYIYAGIEIGPNTLDPRKVVDMNGAHIIRECLTDTIWGMGYPAADIDDTAFEAAADALYTERLGVSFEWDRQTEVREFIDEVLRHIDGVLYVDRTTGKFVLRLLRDDYVVGSMLTLDADTVERVEDASRRSTGELVNTVTVTYTATAKGDAGALTVHDTGLLQTQGGIVSSKLEYAGIGNCYTAAKVAYRNLKVLSSPLQTCTIYASRHAADLNIGDPFILDWPPLEINDQVMRVTSIDVGDGLRGQVKIVCVEDTFYTSTVPVVIPAPIYYPPEPLAPLVTSYTRYHLAQIADPLNRGSVACVYTATGEASLFDGWTEGPTGVWTKDVAGPLTDAYFDGVDPDAYNHQNAPALVGEMVLAFQAVGSPGDAENSGLYIIDDVGGHYVDYGLPTQQFVATYAKMHRPPAYANGSDFVVGMTFFVREGTLHGGKYLTLATDGVALGTTAIDWTESAPPYTWANERRLLTAGQLGTENPTSVVVDATVTGGDGATFDGFETTDGQPNIKNIPAGDWTSQLEEAEVTGGDVGATTTLGFQLYRNPASGVGGGVLFEARSAALGAAAPLTTKFAAPELPMERSDGLVLIPCIRTTSGTAVTVRIRYNGQTHSSSLIMPTMPWEEPKRSPCETAVYADQIIVVPGRAWSAKVALTGNVIGMAIEDYQDGDEVSLTLTGATGGAPFDLVHGGSPGTGSAPLFLVSRSGLGVTYDNVRLKADPARVVLKLDADNTRWLLVGGPYA